MHTQFAKRRHNWIRFASLASSSFIALLLFTVKKKGQHVRVGRPVDTLMKGLSVFKSVKDHKKLTLFFYFGAISSAKFGQLLAFIPSNE